MSTINNQNDLQNKIKIHLEKFNYIKSNPKRLFISISRKLGTSGTIIANRVAEKLNKMDQFIPNWMVFKKEHFKQIRYDANLYDLLKNFINEQRIQEVEKFIIRFKDESKNISDAKESAKIIRMLSWLGHVILVGTASSFITKGVEMGFHIQLVGTKENRINTLADDLQISCDQAENFIDNEDQERSAIDNYFKSDNDDPIFDLIIDRTNKSVESAVDLIITNLVKRGIINIPLE